MVTVRVGYEEISFTVDKSTLLISSELFKKGLDTLPNTDRLEVIDLPDAKPRAFEIYLGWLETGHFYIMEGNDVRENNCGEMLNNDEFWKWDECYKLGYAIQDCGFQDACIDWLQEKIISEGDMIMIHVPETVYMIDDQVPAHCQLFVDIAAHLWGDWRFEEMEEDDYPSEFLMDLLKHVSKKMRHNKVAREKPEDFFKDVGCKYHAHVALNKPCYKETHPAYK